MVRRPISYLERRGVRCKDILSNVRLPPANKVQDLKDGFYSGNVQEPSLLRLPPSSRLDLPFIAFVWCMQDMDIPDGSDPYVIGELLKEYFRDLRQPLCTYKRYEVFDQINGNASPFFRPVPSRVWRDSWTHTRRAPTRQTAARAAQLHR